MHIKNRVGKFLKIKTMSTSNNSVENVATENGTFQLNQYVTVIASNCSLQGEGYGDDAVLTVSNIQSGSKLYFQTPSRYPLADQNWFHFTHAKKNIYFDNRVKVNPTGRQGITISFIEFTEAPNASNTAGENPISTQFDIVNENGNVNDPTLKIVWL